ncbi:MAG: CARDB domain-containing protein [Caldilineaceae bacterium]
MTISALVLNSGTADASDILVQFTDMTDDAGLPIGTEQIIDSLPAGGSVTLEVTYTDTDEAGERRIQVAVDPSNSIEESDETDNRAAKTLVVSPPKVPNLMIQPSAIEFAPAKPVEGDQVMVTMTVANNGTAPVSDVQVLVTDVTDNGSDPVGEPLVIESLGAGESATLNTTYDTNGKAGSRQIQVTVDPDDAIEETNEDDNQATKTIPVASEDETPPDAPNLVIFAGNIKFEPEAPGAGDPVTITVNVLNQGTQDADDLVIRFVDVTDDGEEVIGDVTLTETVPAGDSAEVTMTYDTTDKEGERSIQVIADPDNAIEETDEDDNSATKTLTVGAPSEASATSDDTTDEAALASASANTVPVASSTTSAARLGAPNLVVTSQDIVIDPAVVGDGGVINVTAQVHNAGDAPVANVTVLINDATGSEYIVAGRQQTIAAIPAGGSAQVQVAYVVLDRPFERTVQVQVDPENQIAESDEFDNVAQVMDEPADQGYGPAVEGR